MCVNPGICNGAPRIHKFMAKKVFCKVRNIFITSLFFPSVLLKNNWHTSLYKFWTSLWQGVLSLRFFPSYGKESACNWETWVWSLGQEDLLEGMATHSSILAWRIPWTEEPGGLQSTGSQRVRYDWVTDTHWISLRCTAYGFDLPVLWNDYHSNFSQYPPRLNKKKKEGKEKKILSLCWELLEFFFKKKLFIYLAALSLSWGWQDLRCKWEIFTVTCRIFLVEQTCSWTSWWPSG